MNKRNLLKKKNVVLYYTGKKEVGGVITDRDSIRVGVAVKLPLSALAKSDIIPKTVEGMETDVYVEQEIWALEVDRKAKHRPAPPGVSLAHPKVTAGTFGMVVKKNGVRLILSNNHILANSNAAEVGDLTLQPAPYDGGEQQYICDKCHQPVSDTIGHLFAFNHITFGNSSGCLAIIGKVFATIATTITTLLGGEPKDIINKVDCAIAKPIKDEDISDEILGVGIPVGYGMAKVGDNVKKSGRTTGLTQGNVIAIDGVARINYRTGQAVFENQIITTNISQGGDSGSVVLNENNEVVGLLFAGSDQTTIVNKISDVIEALGLDD